MGPYFRVSEFHHPAFVVFERRLLFHEYPPGILAKGLRVQSRVLHDRRFPVRFPGKIGHAGVAQPVGDGFLFPGDRRRQPVDSAHRIQTPELEDGAPDTDSPRTGASTRER